MSVQVDSQQLFDVAKKKFGVTRDIREAGYVLPDGSMLDFSGRHELGPGTDSSFLNGDRTVDHRQIDQLSFVYDEDMNEVDTGIETNMPDFIERGACFVYADCNHKENTHGHIVDAMGVFRNQIPSKN